MICFLSQSAKGKFAFIGGIFHMLILGSITIIGSFSVYYTSYFKSINPSLSLHYSYLFQPIMTFFITIAGIAGGFIDHKFGSNVSILIGGIILYVAALMFYFAKNIFYGYLCMMIFGIGFGISTAITSKNVCLYFPKKKGLMFACMQSIMNLSSAVYNIIGEKLINPNDEQIIKELDCYAPEIAQNYINYFKLLLFGIIPIGIFLSMTIVQQFEEKIQLVETKSELVEDTIIGDESMSNEEDSDSNEEQIIPQRVEENNKDNALNKSRYKHDIIKAFKSGRIKTISAICFLISFLPFLVVNTFKPIGSLFMINQTVLKLTQSGNGIILCFLNPLFGFLADKFQTKHLVILLNIYAIFVSIVLCFSFNSNLLFAVAVLMNSVLTSGATTIFTPHVMKVFSVKYSMEINGVVGFSLGITNVLGAIFAFVIVQFFGSNVSKTPYIVGYIVGILFNLLSIYFANKESDQPFNYNDDGEDEMIKEVSKK